MTEIAERMTAFAAKHGADVTFTRGAGDGAPVYDPISNTWSDDGDDGDSWTTKAGEAEPEDDDYKGGTLVARNPVVLILPNSPVITFPPASGQRFDYGGIPYAVVGVRPRVFNGAVQYWRVLGGA